MRLIMAVSADGFVARGPDDNMFWLGPYDKAVFKLLTTSGVEPTLIRSRRTEMAMPKVLLGRRLITVSRSGLTLKQAGAQYPSAWLVGGQELATVAFGERGMLSDVYICKSDRRCFDGIPSTLEDMVATNDFRLTTEVTVGDTKVKHYTLRK